MDTLFLRFYTLKCRKYAQMYCYILINIKVKIKFMHLLIINYTGSIKIIDIPITTYNSNIV